MTVKIDVPYKNVYQAEFLSPGTFITENRVVDLSHEHLNDRLRECVNKAKTIKERHNATPYGFRLRKIKRFEEVQVGDTIMNLPEQVGKWSGTYFITGNIQSYHTVPRTKDNNILLGNMWCNSMWLVVTNTNSYRATHPFNEEDKIVGWDGRTVKTGDDPIYCKYRNGMEHFKQKRYDMDHYGDPTEKELAELLNKLGVI